MGFFASGGGEKRDKRAVSLDLLRRLECKVCPLDQIKHNRNPHMAPSGADDPVVYMLGDAPSDDEDRKGRQFVGNSGQLLRKHIPGRWVDKLRWSNVVRTRPLDDAEPQRTEIECCRPSIIRDIEKTKPKAIFGFGNIPLTWACGQSGIKKWRGRRMPVKIGSHACWYYAFMHPASIIQAAQDRYSKDEYVSEDERALHFDLRRAFQELDDLPEPIVHTVADVDRDVYFVLGEGDEDLERVFDELEWAAKQPLIGYDTETKKLRPYHDQARLLTVAISDGKRAFAFPVDHPEARWTKEQRTLLLAALVRFLKAPNVFKVVHNLAFEHEWSAYLFGRHILRASAWGCSLLQAASLDERVGRPKPGCLSLEFLVQQYFGFNLKALAKLDRNNLDREPLIDVLRYNAPDAKYHALLFQVQRDRLESLKLTHVYERRERCVPTVVLTQIKGVPIDQHEVNVLFDKYDPRVKALMREIANIPIVAEFKRRRGKTFNPASEHDVLYIAKDILRSPWVYKEARGEESLSVDESVLEKIDHPIAPAIIDYRKAAKRLTTVESMLHPYGKYLHPDGYLHSILNLAFAETGRTSSEEPNGQNWEKRSEEGKEIRRAVQDPSRAVVSFDYGQIEFRIIAVVSKDKACVKALWERYDIHMDWAKRLAAAYPRRLDFYPDADDPVKAFRGDVKNQWTFPLFFGATLKRVAEELHIPEDRITREYDQFWEEYSGVWDWQQLLLKEYRKNGYVETPNGFRRHAPLSSNQLFNAPIQGGAAELMLEGFCGLSELAEDDWDLQPSMSIHDDLTFLWHPDIIEKKAETVISTMLDVNFPGLNVPLTVEMSVGPNWKDVKEVGKYSSDTWFVQ